MRKGDRKGGNQPPVVIKREEVVAGASHGGAWKVAYADFITAMMAFFLLMWLLNATTEDQRKGLADYFSPTSLLSHNSSGSGEPFGGHAAFDNGAMVSDRGAVQAIPGDRPVNVTMPEDEGEPVTKAPSGPAELPAETAIRQAVPPVVLPPAKAPVAPVAVLPASAAAEPVVTTPPGAPRAGSAVQTPRKPTEAELRAELERREKEVFDQAAQQIRDAVAGDPALADLARQLAIDMTPEGLRIQILDEDRRAMFALGSAVPNDRARLLLQKVTPVLSRLTQAISISGHTDAAPFPGPDRTNWELSTERANATRRLLMEGGLPETRIRTVTGHAAQDLLLPDDPLAAANRRIAIVVLRTVAGR